MTKKIELSTKKERWLMLTTIFVLVLLLFTSVLLLDLEIARFLSRFKDAGSILSQFMTIDFSRLNVAIGELFVSLCMAICGLVIGWLISFVLSFLGARNTTPHVIISMTIKGIVAIIRAVPALVWILLVVASLGFGNTSGVLGLVFPTVGYLTKSFISSIEEQDPAIIETMKATGAGWLQIITEGLLPNLFNQFLAWTSIRLEGNLAESISLGMVGAGGIGMLMMRAIGQYNYGEISMLIILIFLTIVSVELGIGQIKKRLR
ncbi:MULTISPECIES: PhnE/PtxC family ABC transporter permease [unclassified Enterococcus]|uniref:PhnE/PtxC family ABC transporter permease n=1 Tax=unclassified Enterococcus TaxID=2608891 RepID=UPI001A9B2E97|nr:ABC transporter permease subunit [Enterococcus sp. DIV1271a]MBO1300060.1 ABC transporter permease subunit [Enterococcus sp. DIV1271a]